MYIIILIFRGSSVVEQSAVNRSVVGSNPTCGATTVPVNEVYGYKKTCGFGHVTASTNDRMCIPLY